MPQLFIFAVCPLSNDCEDRHANLVDYSEAHWLLAPGHEDDVDEADIALCAGERFGGCSPNCDEHRSHSTQFLH